MPDAPTDTAREAMIRAFIADISEQRGGTRGLDFDIAKAFEAALAHLSTPSLVGQVDGVTDEVVEKVLKARVELDDAEITPTSLADELRFLREPQARQLVRAALLAVWLRPDRASPDAALAVRPVEAGESRAARDVLAERVRCEAHANVELLSADEYGEEGEVYIVSKIIRAIRSGAPALGPSPADGGKDA